MQKSGRKVVICFTKYRIVDKCLSSLWSFRNSIFPHSEYVTDIAPNHGQIWIYCFIKRAI